MQASDYHNLVGKGTCVWLKRLVRSGRYAYGQWRKFVAMKAAELCEVTDRTLLLSGLHGLLGEFKKVETGANRGEILTLKTRCLDLIRALESAASRSEGLLPQ